MTSFVLKILSDRHEFAMTQNAWKRCFCLVTYDLIGLLPTNHTIIMAYQGRLCQTTQKSWKFIVGKSSLLKKWQTSAIIREILYSINLETGRYGPKSGVSRIFRESWQHCIFVKFLYVKNFKNRIFVLLVPNAWWLQGKYIPKQSTSILTSYY